MENSPDNHSQEERPRNPEDKLFLRAIWSGGPGAMIYMDALMEQDYGSEIKAYIGATLIGLGAYFWTKGLTEQKVRQDQ